MCLIQWWYNDDNWIRNWKSMAYAKESITLIIYVYLYTPVEIYLCSQSKSGLTMANNMVSMIFDKISIAAKINFWWSADIDDSTDRQFRYIFTFKNKYCIIPKLSASNKKYICYFRI